jgi:transcriptional/translational regulatory protein YebC/TACO1
MEALKIEPENSGLERIPNNAERLDKGKALKVMKVIERFEEDDDVQNVYHNLEIDDDLVEEYEKLSN